MKKTIVYGGVLVAAAIAFFWYITDGPEKSFDNYYAKVAYYAEQGRKVPKAERRPNDWFYVQRAYPNTDVPTAARLEAVAQVQQLRQSEALKKSAVTWTEAGPTNIPGRITDLAVHPDHPEVIYAASAAGGVFKSTDFGSSWTALFDETNTQSIGAIAIHPTNPNILYVGTGEANSSGDSYEGTGVYKSIDAGATWDYIGLPESYHIGRIVIDPLRPDSVYVAATGKLFGTNAARGLYRSPNGGSTWDQLLYIDDTTGCVDVAIHPATNTLFAAMWHRYRHPRERRVGGWTSGLYVSPDLGGTWSLVSGGLPSPGPDVGRIGVSADPLSSTVYTIFFDHPGELIGVYKSINLGTVWTDVTTDDLSVYLSGGFGWYFGQIRVAPGNPDVAYALGVHLYQSIDGGANWNYASNGIHVDHHAMYILPSNDDRVYDGSDGGVHYTTNGASSWETFHGMPNTQFYAIAIDRLLPERLYGGTQDNSSMRTLTGGTDDWEGLLFGDGFYCIVDFTDSDVIYAEYQYGNLFRSDNSGADWERVMSGMDYNIERHNWSTPVMMDPSDHSTLYYGSDRLYKTTNRGDYWTAISGDLTDGEDPGNLVFGTITTIDVARTDPQVVYVGTDDANVWVTTNGGGAWQDIAGSLPERYVTRVTVDPYDAAVAYVTFSGYTEGSYLPHIFRTDDFGQNWADITGDLPDAPINDVVVDPHDNSTLYVGTDFGVFSTEDLGLTWNLLSDGMPIVPTHDLEFDPVSRKLVAGTHGRSMYQTTMPCPDDTDTDGDGYMDACDNCPPIYNPDQADSNYDWSGDACDFTCDCTGFGDVNSDGQINPVDVVYMVNFVYKNQDARQQIPTCTGDNGDWDCSGGINPVDVVFYVNYVYKNQGTGPCDPCAP